MFVLEGKNIVSRAKTETQKRRTGTWRADAPGKTVQTNRGHELRMPRGMGRHAKWLWRTVVAERSGILHPADAPALMAACQHWELAQLAYEQIQADGITTTDMAHGNEKRKHPSEPTYRQNMAAAISILKQFGISPAARAALPGADDDGRDDDWISKIFEGL